MEHIKNWAASTGESEKARVQEITDRLEEGLKELFNSENYKNYLSTMSKFHSYSANNILLILLQCPNASYVAGYQAWKKDFGRYVKKGETAIRILAPAPYKIKVEQSKIDSVTGEVILDPNGLPLKEIQEINRSAFRMVSIFDISQTEGNPLPEPSIKELLSPADGYENLKQAIINLAPVPVSFKNIPGAAKGYFSRAENRIVIKKEMSQSQTLKTLIHETAHSLLHNTEMLQTAAVMPDNHTKEVEAESVAYTVCQYFGLDTSDYSFGYIAGWSSGKEMPELKASLDTIRKTAAKLIDGIEAELEQFKLTCKAAPAPEYVIAVSNSDYSQFDIISVRNMERTELFNSLFSMTDADKTNAAAYLESCGALAEQLGNETTEASKALALDYIYDTDNCRIVDVEQLEAGMEP